MLVDANILLYAVDSASGFHGPAAAWLTAQLNGYSRVGLPWVCLLAFLRLSTHPRASADPLSPTQARSYVDSWLARDVTWNPGPTGRHWQILSGLVETYQLTGNILRDAHLASLAIEHGLTIHSADTNFARFREVHWDNPL